MFVAVWPPAEVLSLLAAVDRPAHPGLRWTTPDQWHVTLRFLGSLGEMDIAALGQRWELLDFGSQPTVLAVLGPTTARFGNRILHVPVAGLDQLAETVIAATRDIGEPPDERPYAGHITLARARDRGADLGILAGTPLAAAWTVAQINLVVSHTHPDGARYETVKRRWLSPDREPPPPA
jgi:2'-5' RNA ligase